MLIPGGAFPGGTQANSGSAAHAASCAALSAGLAGSSYHSPGVSGCESTSVLASVTDCGISNRSGVPVPYWLRMVWLPWCAPPIGSHRQGGGVMSTTVLPPPPGS